MRKIFLIGLIAVLAVPTVLRADRLDDLEAKLDRLETRFWVALGMAASSAYNRETESLLFSMVAEARDIQTILSHARYRDAGNLSTLAVALERVFSDVDRQVAASYRFRFEKTSMREFQREYRRSLSREGKRDRALPTLATAPIDDYENWLHEVCTDNLDKFSSRRSVSAVQEREFERLVAQYFDTLTSLRMALVKLRQQSGLEFKK